MYTFNFSDGILQILNDSVVAVIQPFNPITMQPWTSEQEALDWAKAETTAMGETEDRRITPLAFTRRLTLLEHGAAIDKSRTDSTVAAVIQRTTLARFVDLNDPETREGLELFAADGIITADRVDAILNAPVLTSERV